MTSSFPAMRKRSFLRGLPTWCTLVTALVVAAAVTLMAIPHGLAEPFTFKRGLGVAGPFVSFVKRDKIVFGEKVTRFVFRGLPQYLDKPHFVAPAIKEMGFDFIRLSVNPAILLRSDGAERDALMATLERGVDYYHSAGLKVLYNLQFWTPDELWTWETVLNPNAGQFDAYRNIVRRSARMLLKYPRGDVAIEPMNEPNATNCNDPSTGWLAKQRTLIADIRAIDGSLPILVSGCVGQLDGLLTVNPGNVDMTDPNLVYSFHFYEPFFFTHQTSPFHFPNVDTVRYPASAARLEDSLAAALEAIDAAAIAPDAKDAQKSVAIREFGKYYAADPGPALIRDRMAVVSDWANKHAIPPGRIILGEFAALNWSSHDSDSFRRSRIAWDRDVRREAEAAGFAWAFWASPLKDDIVDALGLKQAPGSVGAPPD